MALYLENFHKALKTINPYIKRTPLVRCEKLEKALHTPHRIFIKLESEQLTQSFKIRGAFNALLNLTPSQRAKGVVTRSSGNFAQAIACAGKTLGIDVAIVMPTNAPEIKIIKTKEFDPELIFAGTSHEEGDVVVERLKLERGSHMISPYNHLDVIHGQGTISLEVYEELPHISHFFCPIGGGGLMSGCAASLKLLDPTIETIGVEPEGANDYYHYRLKGYEYSLKSIDTICDGLRATQVGSINRPILDKYVDQVTSLSDQSVIQAMKFLKDHYGMTLEPSGAIAIAGLIAHPTSLKGDAVCVISGANISQSYFDELLKDQEASDPHG